MFQDNKAGGTFIVEIATFNLNEGVTMADFAPLDKAVADEHVSQQPGFIARQSGGTEDGQWLAIVYWESIEAVEASMASFAAAPAAADFMANLDASSMRMTRYISANRIR